MPWRVSQAGSTGLELNFMLNAPDTNASNIFMDGPEKHPGITHFALLCAGNAAAMN